MRIIKVDAIPSTNDFVKQYYTGNSSFEPVCVSARFQTKGKGQRGAVWNVAEGKNLTFSLLYPKVELTINHRFLLSAVVSLSVVNILRKFYIPKLSVKWPNDIMSGNFKVGGILIENILKKSDIAASIVGIGLNVNQDDFGDLKQASSLKLLTGTHFNLDEILKAILDELSARLKALSKEKETFILEEYAALMFKKDVVAAFQYPNGEYFNGIIRGVTTNGLLNIEIEDAVFKTFDLKEVKLMY
ncbi:MAG: biotin--[acetyl-CoA-carboxylase] ligase [Zunongwangia sp.]|jgi:BirA family biotin operon repressor/biotin-[acetyl-CoA-carboxylase] ligase|uniref:Biotin--acetyl-CoA-carboxylase ligase n=2 Tax=Zunongwangia profunda TaxID=398743 RepID=D5BGK1_ZUNPS|nr:biotin--[acetyl-CoA-carboxylase] ligase [Zunongwangia profunda]MAO37519.1 biotin--[acetyl-CoA-carboxylase] ligase [Zunongwangia sp.]ADF51160.1 biotin--acetyl-CoA-carboxylase ligase [Zunongwangia profunda SM-A87]MAS72955.1 biotin--[acetyl-CoA-carboxylase] ligase [Zunongwangia sp.]HAJ82432.1 biotin--[acetyl-CoA-carboxylase] ligase [Zunongwangia profunda]HCV81661.1 biotin--[acetyl-CoA-carboxylase] ligase [Zunongwangia profunda]|tara:strand:- start:2463 stop:3194 length:732 start_codon:yes stop_codon:yes gene_type:complete